MRSGLAQSKLEIRKAHQRRPSEIESELGSRADTDPTRTESADPVVEWVGRLK
jgi:hypothetical protein